MSEPTAVVETTTEAPAPKAEVPHGDANGAIIDHDSIQGQIAARRAAAIAAAGGGEDEDPTDPELPVSPSDKPEPKVEPKAPAEPAPETVETAADRVKRYIQGRAEKAEAAKLKAEIEGLRAEHARALQQAKLDAQRELTDKFRKAPKAALGEYGLDPSQLVQSAMDELTTDPVRKLELQIEQQRAAHADALRQIEELKGGLQQRETQQTIDHGRRAVLSEARNEETYPLLNARFEGDDNALLQTVFAHAHEYQQRAGSWPDTADLLTYLEDRERSIYTKVQPRLTMSAAPKTNGQGRTKGIPQNAAAARISTAQAANTPEARRQAAKEAYLKAERGLQR